MQRLIRRHEQAKKREYGERIREIEHGVFTPLVLSTTGGMGREATTFYKRLADLIAQKRQHPYPTVMGWLRCRLSFASLEPLSCVFEAADLLFTVLSVGQTSPWQHLRDGFPLTNSPFLFVCLFVTIGVCIFIV